MQLRTFFRYDITNFLATLLIRVVLECMMASRCLYVTALGTPWFFSMIWSVNDVMVYHDQITHFIIFQCPFLGKWWYLIISHFWWSERRMIARGLSSCHYSLVSIVILVIGNLGVRQLEFDFHLMYFIYIMFTNLMMILFFIKL